MLNQYKVAVVQAAPDRENGAEEETGSDAEAAATAGLSIVR